MLGLHKLPSSAFRAELTANHKTLKRRWGCIFTLHFYIHSIAMLNLELCNAIKYNVESRYPKMLEAPPSAD